MPNNQFVLIAILYTMSFSLRRASDVARRWAVAVLFAAAPVAAQSAAVPPVPRVSVDHSPFDRLLRAHVTDGLVDYDAFRDAAAFRRYLTSLERASLRDADLRDADLEDARLEGAERTGVRLAGANLDGATGIDPEE